MDLLRRRVHRRAHEPAVTCYLRSVDETGQPEVRDPRLAVFIDEDIGRFDVTMDDVGAVRARQRGSELCPEQHRPIDRKRCFF